MTPGDVLDPVLRAAYLSATWRAKTPPWRPEPGDWPENGCHLEFLRLVAAGC